MNVIAITCQMIGGFTGEHFLDVARVLLVLRRVVMAFQSAARCSRRVVQAKERIPTVIAQERFAFAQQVILATEIEQRVAPERGVRRFLG